ncbi:JAB domain-containing protein [Tahibacter soli]|uniref:JAB domain-containing protein n=1 Tax=Tahibacter soli TaxID=2983605 RepID=A0A9X4BG39_9GAMM|nr:JAB domain-containing protein [Tahibacter soli]MDC8010991.1 JAB domain-containing protein [Tahibacter soli]
MVQLWKICDCITIAGMSRKRTGMMQPALRHAGEARGIARSERYISTEQQRQEQARDDRLIQRALAVIESRARDPGALLAKPSLVADWFRLRLGAYEREVFAVAWLDVRHRLIEFRELFAGTIDRTEVHLREVVKSALACNAAAAVFAHNHPSGYAEPSQLDIELTEYLQVNLGALGVAVLDHLVVTTRSAVSVYGSPLRIKALHRLSPPIPGAETSGRKPGRTARKRDE